LRKSPFYRDEFRAILSAGGMVVTTPRTETSLDWSAFTRAARLASGFLLFTGPTDFYWLPDSALAQGSLPDVANILRRNVRFYEGDDG
jgi:hypothetical protein